MSLESFQQSVSCRWSIFQDETPTLLKECLMFLWRSVHLLSPRIILRSVWARTCRGNKNSPGRIQQVQTAQTPDGDWPDCRCSAGRHDSYESVCSVLLTSDSNHFSLSESLLINVFTVTLFILNVVLKHSWCFYGVSHQLYVLFLFLFLLPLIKHYSVFKCLNVCWFCSPDLCCWGSAAVETISLLTRESFSRTVRPQSCLVSSVPEGTNLHQWGSFYFSCN